MVIDPAARVAELYVVPYDVEACRRDLRARGLPPAGCHLRPTLRQTAARIWRRRL
jgi:hypothetical protein